MTGANDGIGLALCKRLVTEQGCFVYMGSRSLERGTAAMKSLGLTDSMELGVHSSDIASADHAVFR